MKYLYHYHILHPLKDGSTNHHSGVLDRSGPIDSVAEYQSAIAYILRNQRVPANQSIVTSLSLLNPPLPTAP